MKTLSLFLIEGAGFGVATAGFVYTLKGADASLCQAVTITGFVVCIAAVFAIGLTTEPKAEVR